MRDPSEAAITIRDLLLQTSGVRRGAMIEARNLGPGSARHRWIVVGVNCDTEASMKVWRPSEEDQRLLDEAVRVALGVDALLTGGQWSAAVPRVGAGAQGEYDLVYAGLGRTRNGAVTAAWAIRGALLEAFAPARSV
jgi:hypothetical protein